MKAQNEYAVIATSRSEKKKRARLSLLANAAPNRNNMPRAPSWSKARTVASLSNVMTAGPSMPSHKGFASPIPIGISCRNPAARMKMKSTAKVRCRVRNSEKSVLNVTAKASPHMTNAMLEKTIDKASVFAPKNRCATKINALAATTKPHPLIVQNFLTFSTLKI